MIIYFLRKNLNLKFLFNKKMPPLLDSSYSEDGIYYTVKDINQSGTYYAGYNRNQNNPIAFQK